MKSKIKTPLLAIFIVFAFAIASVAATSPPILKRMPKKRIRVWADDQIIRAKDVFLIAHGWRSGPNGDYPDFLHWSEMSQAQKVEFLNTASFELYIDDVAVPLERLEWYDKKEDEMYVIFYKMFRPFSLEQGIYEFRGEWNIDVDGVALDPWIRSIVVTVN